MSEASARADWLEAILVGAGEPLLLVDPSGTVVDCSLALADALGSSREVLRGLTLHELVDGTRPALAGALEALAAGDPAPVEVALATGGEPRWMELRGRRVGAATLVRLRDTTHDRVGGEAEPLLALVGRHLPGVMWTTDVDLHVTGIVGGGLAMRNRSRADLLGVHAFDYFGTRDPSAEPVRAHLEALDGRVGYYDFERAGRRFGATVEPIGGPDGEVLGVVGIALEVAEPRALAERLRSAHREQTVGRLAGSLANDFNNLLTVIAAHAALLEDGEATSSPAEDLAAIREAAAKGKVLTSRLLSVTERQIQQPRRFRADTAVAELEPMLRSVLGERRELAVVTGGLPAWIEIDPGLLEQVLLSIVDNSRQATEEGGAIEVRVDCVSERGGAEWVEVSVRDDGVGMSDAVRARVTEAFFTTRSPGRGVGLGLTNALAVVRGAGGALHIESELGVGSLVSIRLPRAQAPSGVRSTPPRTATETVLLVEDQVGVRRATRRILKRAGYTVFEASHGEDALALATTFPGRIDVLLTDVVMPGMSGPQLATALLEQRPELVVLYMSGYAEDVEEVRAALSRGQTFLAKPFAPEALLQSLRDAIEGPPEVEPEEEDGSEA